MEHTWDSRHEAARKLLDNHANVLRDITNPSRTLNIDGKPLTQQFALERVAPEGRLYVDQFLREVSRRLLGRQAALSKSPLDKPLEIHSPERAFAWVVAAKFLDARVQSTPQQRAGREPDMSAASAAAFRAVMGELRDEASVLVKAAGFVRPKVESSAQAAQRAAAQAASPAAMPAIPAAQPPRPPAQAVAPTPNGGDGGAPVAAYPVRELPGPALSADEALHELSLAKRGVQKWIASRDCEQVLEGWHSLYLESISTSEGYAACVRRHFGPYEPPPDCAGWMLQLAVLAESLPICVTISDAQVAGFPLVYVNSKFEDVTGYSKTECSGRNCRFLQGPATNPEHGQHLLDTLRRGQNSQTMMVNYRKSGEPFENLLTMRYVNDSAGRRRLCVGFQLDLSGFQSDSGPWGRRMLQSDEGQALVVEAQNKMVKLMKMLPTTIDVPAAPLKSLSPDLLPEVGSCPQLKELAKVVGEPEPRGKVAWFDALCSLLARAAQATLVVDMLVPGLPIAHCNSAFVDLTGWSPQEAVGRNCRFLQGEQTEPQALGQLITAIRRHEARTLTISNVRKDGSVFPNNLSLHPVHDSNGICRYFVASLSDDGSAAPGTPLALLRKAIPTSFDAALQPAPSSRFGEVDPLSQWRTFQPATSKLVRLLWALDMDGALRKLLTLPPPLGSAAVESLRLYLAKKVPADAPLLNLILEEMNRGRWQPTLGRADQGR